MNTTYLPNTRMFFPDGSLDLDRVETSLRIEDLYKRHVRITKSLQL